MKIFGMIRRILPLIHLCFVSLQMTEKQYSHVSVTISSSSSDEDEPPEHS